MTSAKPRESSVGGNDSVLVSMNNLAKLLGLSPNALRWHIRQGRITPIRLGRRLLFDPEAVLAELSRSKGPNELGRADKQGVSKQQFFENRIAERALGISKKES